MAKDPAQDAGWVTAPVRAGREAGAAVDAASVAALDAASAESTLPKMPPGFKPNSTICKPPSKN